MSRYLVKDKFTYERIPQTDYTYNPGYLPYSWIDGRVQSHNAILPLYQTEPLLSPGILTAADGAPADLTLTDAMRDALCRASALRVTPEEGGAVYRATFFGADGASFSSVGTARAGQSDLFSLARMDFAPVRLRLETDGAPLTAALSFDAVWNTLGEWGGQAHFYTPENAVLTDRGCAMALTVSGRGGFASRSLPLDPGGCYSMRMPRRNTVFLILSNPDGLSAATLSFTSETAPDYLPENAVTLPLPQDAEKHALYFNLSACPGCSGRLTGFRLEVEGHGTLLLHGYSFEQEKPLEISPATVTDCVADAASMTLTVTGSLDTGALPPAYANGQLCLYAGTMADAQGLGASHETTAGKMPVGSIPLSGLSADGGFRMADLPLRAGETTLLPYQLLLFAEAEGQPPRCLSDRFYIENYELFGGNPFAFDLPDYTVRVTDFGACGDAVHNDTDAIQAALDHVSAAGGGCVVLPGSTDRYGRRYIVTSLLLRDNVELHFEDGALLWQSQRRDEYPYQPAVGHDGVIPGVNWTHNLHVSNLPLVQGANLSHIKITGHGSIRMLDTGSEEGVDMPGYAAGCYRRIHCIPLGLFCCSDVETRDFEIIRTNNYNTEYNHCRRVYIANIRLHEVKCVSGDGYGVAGAQGVYINRCFLQSNDDGVVMSCHYHDPRGILWWTNLKDEDNSCRNITVVHSYLNSGGGKGLAFITWGTSDPIQEHEEVSGVYATDNYLTSVNPVGSWYDNPYNGKQPFDNSETDDYSPVRDVRIFGNRYDGNCTLGPIRATNILTDCGIGSAPDFRNGDFSLGGMANWTAWKNDAPDSAGTVVYADKEKGRICRFDRGFVAAAQGLRLEAGQHVFRCELMTGAGGAELFVARIPALGTPGGDDIHAVGEVIASRRAVCTRPTAVSLSFELTDETTDVFVGLRRPADGVSARDFAVFDACAMESHVDHAAIAAHRRERFIASTERVFDTTGFRVEEEEGKLHLRATAGRDGEADGRRYLPAHGKHTAFVLGSAVRANAYDPAAGRCGFGYRFGIRDGGARYTELCFNAAARTLTLTDVSPDGETVLYRRTNFFFTSMDFHIFRLEVRRSAVSVWVDGSLYTTVPHAAQTGGVAAFYTDMDASVSGLTLE